MWKFSAVFVVIDIGGGLFDVSSFVYCCFWVAFCRFVLC